VSQTVSVPDVTGAVRTARTLVVLPTYNERENLEKAVRAVRDAGLDVLIVDDSSPDGTGELAARMAEADPGVQVLVRPGKLGLGSAYVDGFRCGLERGYDFLVEMDADGSHRPEYLPEIVRVAASRGGMVIGSRYVRGGSVSGWGWHRKLLSWGANVYCRTLLGLKVRDATSGYRCYPREVLEAIGLDRVLAQGYSFQIEMVYRCLGQGYEVHEVPIHFEDRVAGRSKVSEGEVRKALLSVLMLRLRGVPSSQRRR
jgi:dolichol-phosphate mannosyltransferase